MNGFRKILWLVVLSVVLTGCANGAADGGTRLILDMVHHNPGEGGTHYASQYEIPEVIEQMGYNGKVYFLFDSPTLAVDWDEVDPDILPEGSEEEVWVNAKAGRIKHEMMNCHRAGIQTYAMADLILFPKRLIEKYGMEKTFGDPTNPQTQKFLRNLIRMTFEQFPLDGLVVRIGETYLQDAPYHQGKIQNKTNPEKTIIPLIQLLREEICVKLNKKLIFRTWGSFDRNPGNYQKVSDAIEPHPNLVISIKHCEGDFHRGNSYSRSIGQGRHQQIIEVQCAREYEGKGAYPNYIAHGVIEGFEEHAADPKANLRTFSQSDNFAGIWTWTRGGGWQGPYISNELWCDVNAWVMANWAKNPSRPEAEVFEDYCRQRLGLKDAASIKKFRRLCLLSADAVLRGKTSVKKTITPWWSRDFFMSAPPLPKNKADYKAFFADKDEAVAMWKEMIQLAEEINWPDEDTERFAVTSCHYGYYVYRIYQLAFELRLAMQEKDAAKVKTLLAEYDKTWADFRTLKANHMECSTLYTDLSFRYGKKDSLRAFIQKCRTFAESK